MDEWSAGLDTRIQRSGTVAASGPVIQESLRYGNGLVGTEWDPDGRRRKTRPSLGGAERDVIIAAL